MTKAQTAAALPIGLLAAGAFLGNSAARVVDPLLHVIASDFATTVPAVSVLIAAFTLPYGLCQIVLGPLGDKFGKLRVILLALCAYAIALLGCALSTGLGTLTLMRIAAGATSAAAVPIGMAYIADAVPYAERQVTLTKFLNGVVLAQILAGPVGGIFGQFIGWRGVFALQAAVTIVVATILARRLRHLPDPRGAGATFSLSNYITLARPGLPRLILLAAFIDGMLLMGAIPFLAPYMREQFGLPYAAIGAVLACFGLGALIYTRSARHLLARLGESGLVLAGGILASAALVLAMLSPAWQAFILVQLILGLGYYLLHSVLQAQATEMLPNARGTAVASFALALFMGQSLGALAMGALIAHFSYHTAFLLDAAGILALGAWLRLLLRPAP